MNRREFLAAFGAGALSLAGKGIRRDNFTLEVEVDRNVIWVNGKLPDKAWSHDEGLSRIDIEFKDLVVKGVKIESLKADTNDTCSCYRDKGTEVVMVNSKGKFRGVITNVVNNLYAVVGDAKPVKVTLSNGETLEINQGQFFYRIEF